MALGAFRSTVIDVGDLQQGEQFWGAVLGLEPQFDVFAGQFSRLGTKGPGSVLLQRVPEQKTSLKNRLHIDLTVDDVQQAVEQAIALGATLVRAPELYPTDDDPMLEWAVMADPWGNEFCLIREVVPTL